MQTMEKVEMGCVLFNVVGLVLSNSLLISSVRTASKANSQRHMILITWAVVPVLAIDSLLNMFSGGYQ